MTALWFLIFGLSRGINSVYTKKAQSSTSSTYRNSIFFVFIYALFQAIFLVTIPPFKNIPMTMDLLIYPTLFGVFYIISYIMLFYALGTGPTGLTNVIYTFHSILPMITGIFIWNDKLDLLKTIGIIFAAISIYLFYQSVKNGDKSKMSVKWIIYVVAATVAMGIAVIFTQAFSQRYYDMNKQYLVVYTITSSIISLVMFLMTKHKMNRPQQKDNAMDSPLPMRYYVYVLLAAISQNAVNLLFMYFLNIMPSTVLFPTMNSVNIIVFVLVGKLFFSEKLNRLSFLGICCSILSLVLLNI
ncbi:MAG TPA: hypothetical protein DDZ89_16550 [Clostridiales bacterium]|nr:hypothetical protein [Clostridiales bacterium]